MQIKIIKSLLIFTRFFLYTKRNIRERKKKPKKIECIKKKQKCQIVVILISQSKMAAARINYTCENKFRAHWQRAALSSVFWRRNLQRLLSLLAYKTSTV